MPNTCCSVRAEHRPDLAGELVGQPRAADLQQRAACAGRRRRVRRRARSQRLATAGTAAVAVTPSAAIVAKARSGSGDASMTTGRRTSSVPRMPGQASGKLCPAGRRHQVHGVRHRSAHSSALARAL